MSGSVNVYLQFGSISEDLDGSGVLKAELSSTDTGFAFVQASPPVTLKVGAGPQLTGNGKLDTEDVDANAILDLEDPFRVVTEGPTTVLSSSWQNFTFALNDTDRQKLMQARSMRIVIVESIRRAATGEILVDSLSFEGTPFWPQTNPSSDKGNVQIQEVTENIAQAQPVGGDFASRFPDTYKRFHPNGETNQVLETVWQAGLTAPFAVQGFIPQGTSDSPEGTGGIQYETVVSYVRAGPAAGTTYTFSLLDSSSRGIVWAVPDSAFSVDVWHEVKVSKKDNTVTVDGTNIGPPLQFDSAYGSLGQLKITVGTAAPPAGHLYVDEIYLTDPQSVFGAAFVGSLSAKFPGMILSAGKCADSRQRGAAPGRGPLFRRVCSALRRALRGRGPLLAFSRRRRSLVRKNERRPEPARPGRVAERRGGTPRHGAERKLARRRHGCIFPVHNRRVHA